MVAGLTSIVPTNFFILTGSYVGFSGSTISPINSRYYGYDGIGWQFKDKKKKGGFNPPFLFHSFLSGSAKIYSIDLTNLNR